MPDLVCEIRSAGLTKRRAKELAAASRGLGGLRVVAAKHRGEWHLELPEASGLLSDEGDLAATTWRMDPGRLPRLAETVEWLLAELPEESTFQVAWPPRDADLEVVVSRDELVRVVRAGLIGTRTRYRLLAA